MEPLPSPLPRDVEGDAVALGRQLVEETKAAPERGMAVANFYSQSADSGHRAAGLWAKGAALFEQGFNAGALDVLNEALLSSPPELEAWIEVTLAAAEAADGRSVSAHSRLEAVLGEVAEGHLLASAASQLGMLLLHDGKPREALSHLDRAVEILDIPQTDRPLLARALGNKGYCHLVIGEVRRAELSWLAAMESAEMAKQDLAIAGLHQNLAYTRMCLGDLPGAIERGRKALGLYRDLGAAGRNLATLYDDLAEIHRFAGLAKDAVRYARLSLWVARQGSNLEKQSDAEFRRARCLLDVGNYQAAAASAQAAAEMFSTAGRNVWVQRAQLLTLEAEVGGAADDQTVLDVSTIEKAVVEISTQLVQAGWVGEAMAARNLAAQLIAEKGNSESARLVLTDNPLPAELASENMSDQLEAFYSAALGQRLLGADNTQTLVEARVLVEESRSGLVDPELRAGVARQLARFRALDIDRVLDGPIQPWGLVEADERWGDTATAGTSMLSSQSDNGDLLPELRLLHQQRTSATEHDPDLDKRILRLEREIRERSMARSTGKHRTAWNGAADLDRQLFDKRLRGEWGQDPGGTAFVSCVVHRGSLFGAGFNLDGEGGGDEVWQIGPVDDLKADIDRVAADLGRLLISPTGSRTTSAKWDALKADCGRLRDLILGDRLNGGRPVVIAPPFELGALPWSLIVDQASMVSVVRGAGQWCRQQPQQSPGTAILATGPDVPQASMEADALEACFGSTAVSLARTENATSDQLLAALASRDLVHVSAHCTFRDDSVMFSSIEMADGPVPIYELGRLAGTPSLVVLAACGAGRWEGVGSAQWLGIVPELLRSGTDCLVAPIQAVADSDAGVVMAEFYRHLRQLGAAGALAATQAALVDAPPRVQAAAHSFLVFGAASVGRDADLR